MPTTTPSLPPLSLPPPPLSLSYHVIHPTITPPPSIRPRRRDLHRPLPGLPPLQHGPPEPQLHRTHLLTPSTGTLHRAPGAGPRVRPHRARPPPHQAPPRAEVPSILFNSHLDSVPAEPDKWAYPPFSAVRPPDGKIFARGVQDEKSIGVQFLEAIRNLRKVHQFESIRTVHLSYVPDEEIGGFDGAARFVESKDFEDLNVRFVMDEGQASPNDEFRVFYAERSPWHVTIRATGQPGHGSRMYDNSAMDLRKTVKLMM